MYRTAKFVVFIGTNGTGKSTIMKKFLNFNRRNLIIPANSYDKAWDNIPELKVVWIEAQKKYIIPEINTFQGTKKIIIYDPKIFKAVTDQYNGFKNGGLFMDDFKNYIPSKGSLPPDVNRLFSDRRHKMIDIFCATHSFQKINADLFDFSPTIFCFNTTRPLADYLVQKVGNFEGLKTVYDRVKLKAKQNPHYFEIFDPGE